MEEIKKDKVGHVSDLVFFAKVHWPQNVQTKEGQNTGREGYMQ